MTLHERVVMFPCQEHRLIGIISARTGEEDLGVLVVPGAPQYRVGAHRQFVLLSRRLAAAGVAVMRFDYRGVGDSSGTMPHFDDIQPDIAAALAAFRESCPALRRVVLLGLCDGASASVLYWNATADAQIAGVALLNPWVSSDQQFAHAQVGRSFQRVLQAGFWSKLFRGEIDLTAALRSLAKAILASLRPGNSGPQRAAFQQRMAAGIGAFDGPVLIVLSGRDLVSAEFLALAEDPAWRTALAGSNVERCMFPEADHTFSRAEYRESAEAAIVAWLKSSFRLGVTFSGMCSLVLSHEL